MVRAGGFARRYGYAGAGPEQFSKRLNRRRRSVCTPQHARPQGGSRYGSSLLYPLIGGSGGGGGGAYSSSATYRYNGGGGGAMLIASSTTMRFLAQNANGTIAARGGRGYDKGGGGSGGAIRLI